VCVPGPYLTGEYGSYIVRGTQEGHGDTRYWQAASTMKHFQLYDVEGYQPNRGDAGLPSDVVCDRNDPGPHCGRGTLDNSPPARDFAAYYLAAFKTVAQRGRPAAIMCACEWLICSSALHLRMHSRACHTAEREPRLALTRECPFALTLCHCAAQIGHLTLTLRQIMLCTVFQPGTDSLYQSI
jgi:hypothetical protein